MSVTSNAVPLAPAAVRWPADQDVPAIVEDSETIKTGIETQKGQVAAGEPLDFSRLTAAAASIDAMSEGMPA
ncbi:hypothetical protein [Frankia sp. QA3]|uniref:hypothetical protein n=1 Tax=Frankia sp. QA3 TaxID=710111 RepID=UPI0002F5D4BD|nr:hypothetical protein [Frankia sp. QA3]